MFVSFVGSAEAHGKSHSATRTDTRMSQLRPELALSTLTPDAAIDIVKWMPCAVNLLPEFRSAAVEEFRRGNKDQRLVGIRHGPGASEIRGLALYRYALPRSFACPLLAF